MNKNRLCPHCKKSYLEPIVMVLDPYEFVGWFQCNLCLKESYFYEMEEEVIYAYPFEECALYENYLPIKE